MFSFRNRDVPGRALLRRKPGYNPMSVSGHLVNAAWVVRKKVRITVTSIPS
jgi:hypothetical protein